MIRTRIETWENNDGELVDIEVEYDDSIPHGTFPKIDYLGLSDEIYPIARIASPFDIK